MPPKQAWRRLVEEGFVLLTALPFPVGLLASAVASLFTYGKLAKGKGSVKKADRRQSDVPHD
jgi:hypothetical protein